MKKVFAFLLIAACVCASCLTKIENNPLYSFDEVDQICFVSDHAYEGLDSVQCGDLFFNYCTQEEAQKDLAGYKSEAKAVQFEFYNSDLEDVLNVLDAQTISISGTESVTILCAWSPYGDECFFVDGMKANLQIAVSDEKIIVGFPAIYTGF